MYSFMRRQSLAKNVLCHVLISGEQVYRCTVQLMYSVASVTSQARTSSGGEIRQTAFSQCVYAISKLVQVHYLCSL